MEGEKLMKINKNCVASVAIVAIVGIVILSAICTKYEPALSFIVLWIVGYSIAGIVDIVGRWYNERSRCF